MVQAHRVADFVGGGIAQIFGDVLDLRRAIGAAGGAVAEERIVAEDEAELILRAARRKAVLDADADGAGAELVVGQIALVAAEDDAHSLAIDERRRTGIDGRDIDVERTVIFGHHFPDIGHGQLFAGRQRAGIAGEAIGSQRVGTARTGGALVSFQSSPPELE